MNATESSSREQHETVYDIRVRGHLDERWDDWLGDLQVTHRPDGTSTLQGPLTDQAALHGVLAQLRDLGVPVISVCEGAKAAGTAQMRAIVAERYGSPDVMEQRTIPKPAPADNEVLVGVRAAGVDRGVWHLVTGLPYLVRVMGYGLRKPKNPVPGIDFAGTVEAVGSAVTKFQPGDTVFGSGEGTFAEFARAREDRVAPLPSGLDFVQAAAVPVSALAALHAVRDEGKVGPGQKVLIIGATGGVGTYAVQLAKAYGAEVTGVGSTAKVDLVGELGVDHVIDYTREDFTRRSERYDVILDIAGNRPLGRLRRVLARRGTLVIVGGENGDRWFGGQSRPLRASLLSPFVSQTLRWQLPRENPGDLGVLRTLIEDGKLKPVVDRTYPFTDAGDALRALEAGQVRGKLVITI